MKRSLTSGLNLEPKISLVSCEVFMKVFWGQGGGEIGYLRFAYRTQSSKALTTDKHVHQISTQNGWILV